MPGETISDPQSVRRSGVRHLPIDDGAVDTLASAVSKDSTVSEHLLSFSLQQKANHLWDMERKDEALAVLEESLEFQRRLALKDPVLGRHLQNLEYQSRLRLGLVGEEAGIWEE